MDEFHPDILKSIFDCLDFKSVLRCKSVCKKWLDTLSSTPNMLNMPWLWISPYPKDESNHHTLLSIADHAHHWYGYSRFPKELLTQEFQCISSSGPWLIISILSNENFRDDIILGEYIIDEMDLDDNFMNEINDQDFVDQLDLNEDLVGGVDDHEDFVDERWISSSNLFLYEPFSHRLLHLPPVDIHNAFSMVDTKYSCFIPSNGVGMVAMCYRYDIFLCQPGADAWEEVEYSVDNGANIFEDLVLHGTNMYVVMTNGQLIVFDVEGYPETVVPQLVIPNWPLISFASSPPGSALCTIDPLAMVVESSDNIFLVRKILYKYPDNLTRNSSFDVFKLDQGRLVKIDNLGSRMLFYGNGSCYSWNGAGLKTGFFTNNCIYYVDWLPGQWHSFRLGKFSLAKPDQNEFMEIPEELWTAVSLPFRKPSWLLPFHDPHN